jgi:hypothetical protein
VLFGAHKKKNKRKVTRQTSCEALNLVRPQLYIQNCIIPKTLKKPFEMCVLNYYSYRITSKFNFLFHFNVKIGRIRVFRFVEEVKKMIIRSAQSRNELICWHTLDFYIFINILVTFPPVSLFNFKISRWENLICHRATQSYKIY